MSIWAIADLHLSFAVPDKSMDIFDDKWKGHPEKIRKHWQKLIAPEDLVLIPGDISWAMRVENAVVDFEWIDALPGSKLLIRGNHDYWWGSHSKVKEALPSSIHAIRNNCFMWKDIAIGGTRLWDSSEYNFNDIIEIKENVTSTQKIEHDNELIFKRELNRLELSLKSMPPEAKKRIIMTHYPPIGLELKESQASLILEKYNVEICVFGHLHSFKPNIPPLFGEKNNVKYILVSSDYVNFSPVEICSL